MAKRANQERERFWQDLIERQPASGLSIAPFCKQAGVSANSFFAWKRRLRSKDGQAHHGTRTSRRRAVTSPSAAAIPLVPVRLLPDPDRSRAPTPRPLKSSGLMASFCDCRRSVMAASCATS